MQDRLLKQFLICLSIFVVLTGMVVFSSRIHLGFFGYLLMLLFGTLFTTIGVTVGDAFRHFVKPDIVFATDTFSLFRTKVFWLIGPQAIGWFIGYMALSGLMHKFGYWGF